MFVFVNWDEGVKCTAYDCLWTVSFVVMPLLIVFFFHTLRLLTFMK